VQYHFKIIGRLCVFTLHTNISRYSFRHTK